jgi:hypothetical protein
VARTVHGEEETVEVGVLDGHGETEVELCGEGVARWRLAGEVVERLRPCCGQQQWARAGPWLVRAQEEEAKGRAAADDGNRERGDGGSSFYRAPS